MSDFRQAPGTGVPWVTLSLAGLMAVLFAAVGPAPEALVFDRAAVGAGEWWRLVTGHWVHSDTGHLGWNLVALLILGWVLERQRRAELVCGLAAGTLAVDAVVWSALPELTHYCGLSGVLNTVLLLALAESARWTRSRIPVLIGVLSLIKILYELAAGQAVLTTTGWASVPLAHLAGWLVGLILMTTDRVPMQWGHQPLVQAMLTTPLAVRRPPAGGVRHREHREAIS